MAKNADFGLRELFRSIYLPAQVAQLQRYIPTITSSDVIRGPAGVRAIALTKDGELVKDFLFISGEGSGEGRILHVINAPSPAATSSLAIAQIIADQTDSWSNKPGALPEILGSLARKFPPFLPSST
eukprot:gene1737-4851_t